MARQRGRLKRQADHQLRLRQLRAHLHAGRQEASVRLEQSQVRFKPLRAVSDQPGWVRPRTGDRLRQVHLLPRVFTGRQEADFLVQLSEQEQLRVQSVYGGLEAVGPLAEPLGTLDSSM